MPTSHRIPRKITDKNGVTKTYSVRTNQSMASLSSHSIVEESLTRGILDSNNMMEDAMETLCQPESNKHEVDYLNVSFLLKNHPELLDRVLSQCRDDANLHAIWVNQVNRTMCPLSEKEMLDQDKFIQVWSRRLEVYEIGVELIRAVGDDKGDDERLQELILGLHEKVNDLLSNPEGWRMQKKIHPIENPAPELVQALAIIGTIRGLYDWHCFRVGDSEWKYSEIEQDAAFIRLHVRRVKDVVPELAKRKNHSVGLIEEMIGGNSATNNGVL